MLWAAVGSLASPKTCSLIVTFSSKQAKQARASVSFRLRVVIPPITSRGSIKLFRHWIVSSVYDGPSGDWRDYVLSKDVIYVGGGNTRNLLTLWRDWTLDRIMREAWEQGIVMTGTSAGSICWFEDGLTDSIPGTLAPLQCLGLLKGSNCPHYDSESQRRSSYQQFVGSGQISPGIACDDGVALHFVNDNLHRVVSSRLSARAYRLTVEGNVTSEHELLPDYLGKGV